MPLERRAEFAAFPPVQPRIRNVTPDCRIRVVAGPGGKFFTNTTAEPALIMPTALAIASDGRVVIADPGANLVRIPPAGSI